MDAHEHRHGHSYASDHDHAAGHGYHLETLTVYHTHEHEHEPAITPDTSPDSESPPPGMGPGRAARLERALQPGADRCPHCESPLVQSREQMTGTVAGRCPVSDELYHRRAVGGFALVADTDLDPSQREDDWKCHRCGQTYTRGAIYCANACGKRQRVKCEDVRREAEAISRGGYGDGLDDLPNLRDAETDADAKTITPEEAERYAFNTYLAGDHGDFKLALARAIQKADMENQYRLAAYWPEMVTAYHCESWDQEPLYVDVSRTYSRRFVPDGIAGPRHAPEKGAS